MRMLKHLLVKSSEVGLEKVVILLNIQGVANFIDLRELVISGLNT